MATGIFVPATDFSAFTLGGPGFSFDDDLDGTIAWTNTDAVRVVSFEDRLTLDHATPTGLGATLHGTGFTTSGGTISGGTIETVVFTDLSSGGANRWLLDLSHPATNLTAPLATPGAEDDVAFLRGLLRGNDTLTFGGFPFGGPPTGGNDTAFGAAGNDEIHAGPGRDRMHGNLGHDTIYGGADKDWLFGGEGADTLAGDAGRDRLFGGKGPDVLSGGKSPDRLVGGKSSDVLWGGGGDDILIGGRQRDTIYGGRGDDAYRYEDRRDVGDTIRDFNDDRLGDDRFEISAEGFGAGLVPGAVPERLFQMSANFGERAARDPDIRFIFVDTGFGGLLYFDPDGSGDKPDMLIAGIPAVTLTADDILIY